MAPTSQRGGADLLVTKLYEQGAIPQNVFSFQVGDDDEKSTVTIGGFNVPKYARHGSTLKWHNLTNPFWWTVNLDKVTLNDDDLGLQTRNVVVDSGTSYNLIPRRDFKIFQKYFTDRNNTCRAEPSLNNMFICECSHKQYKQYPTIKVWMNDVPYLITPKDYIERSDDQCLFKIMTLDMDGDHAFWIMGITFFQNYYAVFDVTNQRVGFAESKLSSLSHRFVSL